MALAPMEEPLLKPLQQEPASEWDTHSLEFSAPFQEIAKLALGFLFPRAACSVSIATASHPSEASPGPARPSFPAPALICLGGNRD